jgi:phosphatidylethanolamine-binding protein (PEBP) family uncharacterized protein
VRRGNWLKVWRQRPNYQTARCKSRTAAVRSATAAPAVGPHHQYPWELYALDTRLELTPDATRADVMKAIDGHILGKGVLVGRFHR